MTATTQRRGSTISEVTLTRDAVPVLRFLVAPGDPRDLLDRNIDLLLTRDRSALDYAATLPSFQRLPLAWHRTYILLSPGRSRPSTSLSADARQALADDAVRGEARGAQEPDWWRAIPDCNAMPVASRSPSALNPRLVYDANDGAARDLAERLVGLVRVSGAAATMFLDVFLPDRPRRTYQRAVGLTGEGLSAALRRGSDAGYVLSVDSRPIEPCSELQAMMDRAPWLDAETMVTMVDTRLQAIVRRGKSGAAVDWDGGLRLAVGDGSR